MPLTTQSFLPHTGEITGTVSGVAEEDRQD
jgi:hypothetical protein